ncbi:hypothetical protein Xcc1_01920 [Xanthomonas campestris pv. campestris]|nr:hypothetical protein Xcc1_01920 [Xanthomonas campestris pv. campestris]
MRVRRRVGRGGCVVQRHGKASREQVACGAFLCHPPRLRAQPFARHHPADLQVRGFHGVRRAERIAGLADLQALCGEVQLQRWHAIDEQAAQGSAMRIVGALQLPVMDL